MEMPSRQMEDHDWSLGEETGLETDSEELSTQMLQWKREEKEKCWWVVGKGRKPELSLLFRGEVREVNKGC